MILFPQQEKPKLAFHLRELQFAASAPLSRRPFLFPSVRFLSSPLALFDSFRRHGPVRLFSNLSLHPSPSTPDHIGFITFPRPRPSATCADSDASAPSLSHVRGDEIRAGRGEGRRSFALLKRAPSADRVVILSRSSPKLRERTNVAHF